MPRKSLYSGEPVNISTIGDLKRAIEHIPNGVSIVARSRIDVGFYERAFAILRGMDEGDPCFEMLVFGVSEEEEVLEELAK